MVRRTVKVNSTTTQAVTAACALLQAHPFEQRSLQALEQLINLLSPDLRRPSFQWMVTVVNPVN